MKIKISDLVNGRHVRSRAIVIQQKTEVLGDQAIFSGSPTDMVGSINSNFGLVGDPIRLSLDARAISFLIYQVKYCERHCGANAAGAMS